MNSSRPEARPGKSRLSIVTPSFNQGDYLEETIRSVLDQGFPSLEYFILDGGSTDRSVEIIRRYETRLAGWVSQADGGQYDAVNRGFGRSTGDLMAWINADDKYLPWTFSVVTEIMAQFPQIEWLTTHYPLFLDAQGRATRCEHIPRISSELVRRGGLLPDCGWPSWSFIQQESTFWRRSLWERAGARLDHKSYPLAADFDLWMRFSKHAELYGVAAPLAGFRQHPAQKTASRMNQYLAEARASFLRHGGKAPGALGQFLQEKWCKVLRFLQKQHPLARACRLSKNTILHRAESGTWELRSA